MGRTTHGAPHRNTFNTPIMGFCKVMKKNRISKLCRRWLSARTLLGVALMVWLGVGYDFCNPFLWTAALLTLIPDLTRE